MILSVRDNPAPAVDSNNGSDLTGHKPSKRSDPMAVTFRRKRRKSGRRARRTSRIASIVRRRRRNPRRKKTRARRRSGTSIGAHRPRLTFKAGKWYGGNSPRSLIRRGSGTRINRRRRRRRTRRNPNGIRGIQRMFSQRILINTAKAGAGIAIGFTAMPIFYRILPQQLKDQRRWLGGIHLALGLSIAGFVRNRDIKDIGMVIAATGVYDLIAMNIDFLGLPPLRTTSPLADKLIPAGAMTPVTAAEATSGYYGASYDAGAAPVSPVAATGVGASFERVGSSYPSLAYPTIGLSGDGGMEAMMDDLIN